MTCTQNVLNIIYRRRGRYFDSSQPLLVMDPAALEEDISFLRYSSTLNIGNSVVQIDNLITINNTTYEPVLGGNVCLLLFIVLLCIYSFINASLKQILLNKFLDASE